MKRTTSTIAIASVLLLSGCPSETPIAEIQQTQANIETSSELSEGAHVNSAQDTPPPVLEVTDEAARASIADGKLILLEYPPLPYPPGHNEYVKLLRDQCDVDYEVLKLPAGILKKDFIPQVQAWNEVIRTEIKRKHGDDIFKQLRADAKQAFKAARSGN